MKKAKAVEIIEDIESKFKVECRIQGEQRLWVKFDKGDLMDACSYLHSKGFEHLSAMSITDWVKEGKYEVTYHLWSYSNKILLTLKTKINRKNPTIGSVDSIWGGNAQIHERELHEFFGIKFEGNNDLSPLFLEDWDGPPPFRKDFNWREYVRDEYYDKQNEREKGYWD